jgi:3-isopropylmalate/(R)-2-methylmalate dehydratase small subunit
MFSGRVWRYGDHVNTDLIIPGRFLDDYDIDSLSRHALEDIDPLFNKNVGEGDVIVAGRNFGCGSSREQAPAVLKQRGVGAVFASSISRIFYRNAINVGLPAILCDETYRLLVAGDIVAVDLEKGRVIRQQDGLKIGFSPPAPHLMTILRKGGLIPYMRDRLRDDR